MSISLLLCYTQVDFQGRKQHPKGALLWTGYVRNPLSFPPVSSLLFYPFGSEAGDTFNNRSDEGSSSAISLPSPFSYFGGTYSQLYVHNNGFLTLDLSWDSYAPPQFNAYTEGDIIAPLWTDIDNSVNGTISYHLYTNGSVLSQATLDINQYYPGVTFTASWVFVATWDKVPYYGNPTSETSFQVVLLSGGNSSFLMMNYGLIAPTTRTLEAGYAASSSDYFQILWSDNSVQVNVSNLSNTSNVNVPGRWAFQVNQGASDNTTEALSTATPISTTPPNETTELAMVPPHTDSLIVFRQWEPSPLEPLPATTVPEGGIVASIHPVSKAVVVAGSRQTVTIKSDQLKSDFQKISFHSLAVPSPLFYPFGSGAGDTVNNRSDDGSSSAISLQRPFSYFGRTYSQLYVNNNGFLTFNELWTNFTPAEFDNFTRGDIIAPLWTDIDNSFNGVISYNQYTYGSVLSRATLDINQYYPGVTFTASWAFVATWDKVPYYSNPSSETSFQVVLISSGNSSFLMMNYGVIAPTNRPVEAGYDASSSDHFEILWLNGSAQAKDLDLVNMSNVNTPGRWVFWVNHGASDNPMKASPSLFYPFGSGSGDTINKPDDDGSSTAIRLQSPFSYFGHNYSQLYVNNNGYLTFDEPSSAFIPIRFTANSGRDIIAPFWTDIKSLNGTISYNQYTNGSVLSQATLDIGQHYPGVTFTASWVFVATWDKVAYFSNPGSQASFQVVLISGGNSFFVLMNYGSITPTSGPVEAGYGTNSSHNFEILWSDSTIQANVSNLSNTSNVNVPGRWAFRVTFSDISENAKTPPPKTTIKRTTVRLKVKHLNLRDVTVQEAFLQQASSKEDISLSAQCCRGPLRTIQLVLTLEASEGLKQFGPCLQTVALYREFTPPHQETASLNLIDGPRSISGSPEVDDACCNRIPVQDIITESTTAAPNTTEIPTESTTTTPPTTMEIPIETTTTPTTTTGISPDVITTTPSTTVDISMADSTTTGISPDVITTTPSTTVDISMADSTTTDPSTLFFPTLPGAIQHAVVYDGQNTLIQLELPFVYFGNQHSEIYLSMDGFLSFMSVTPDAYDPSLNIDIIAPLWTDIDAYSRGNISYEQATSGPLIERATYEMNRMFPELNSSASWVFVGTWEKMEFEPDNGEVTFQVVLISDSNNRSFILMNYGPIPYDPLPWMAGYMTADRTHYFSIQAPSTSDLSSTTNVGIPGRWAFRVDDPGFTTPPPFSSTTPFTSDVITEISPTTPITTAFSPTTPFSFTTTVTSDPSTLFFPTLPGAIQHAVVSDGQNTLIQLELPFVYFGNQHSEIYLSMDGFLSFVSVTPDAFDPSLNIDIIAPLWTDIDAYYRGNISYEQATSGPLIERATYEMNRMFPELNSSASWVFVGTWEKMEFEPDNGEVTFQVVLISDSNNRSFILMNYGPIPYNPLPWMAGYMTVNSTHYFSIQAPSTSDLSSTTNVGISGRWAFRVDAAKSGSSPLFYPFGLGAGDTANPRSDDGSSPAILLWNSFSFFGRSYSQLFVNNNGHLTFDQPLYSATPTQFNANSGVDIIAPFWTDMDNRGSGVISYNQYTYGSVLSRATQDIKQYYPGVNVNASWVFVATWDKVAYHDNVGTETSFQVVLISAGGFSFVLMNYGDIAPTNYNVEVGYDTSLTDYNVSMWSNGTSNVPNFRYQSNVDAPGRLAFLVNQPSDAITMDNVLAVRLEVLSRYNLTDTGYKQIVEQQIFKAEKPTVTTEAPTTTTSPDPPTTAVAIDNPTNATSTDPAITAITMETPSTATATDTSPTGISTVSQIGYASTTTSISNTTTTTATLPFYPFGNAYGDIFVNPFDDGSSPPISLQSPFTFFGHTYSQIYVNVNGYLTFDRPWYSYTPYPFPARGVRDIIAPLWTDIDNTLNGRITHHQYTNYNVVSQATQDINQYFPGLNFTASWVFVATWDNVAYYNQTTQSSFQVVLISGDNSSFILMNYGAIAQTNYAVEAGYDTVNSTNYFQIPRSNDTSFISQLRNSSNVNVPGRWAFRVNGAPRNTSTQVSQPAVFYPYGTGAGDIINLVSDDGSSSAIYLQSPFTFFERTYSQLFVNNNGHLTFDQAVATYVPVRFTSSAGRDIIAPLWIDVDNRINGVISYRQYTNGSVLSRATKDINQYFPGVNFTASWVFVATWDKVGYFSYSGSGQSRLYFLRRLGSFNVCRKLLQMFYQTVVSSCLFYAVVCWGGSIKKRDEMRLDKLVRRAGSVVGVELDSVVKVAERRTLHKLLCIMDDDGHPLHTIIMDRRSKFSGRLLSQSCSTDRLRRSFETSFQVVLISGANFSFVLMNYGDIAPTSLKGEAGYDTNFTDHYEILWSDNKFTIPRLSSLSNVNTPGRWAFLVNRPSDAITRDHVLGVRMKVLSGSDLNISSNQQIFLQQFQNELRKKGMSTGLGLPGGLAQTYADFPATFFPVQSSAVEVYLYSDGDATRIQLNHTFYYFKRQYSQLYLSMNGFLSFEYIVTDTYNPNLKKDIIAPLWVDIDTYNTGSILHEQATSGPLINLATEQVNQMFPGLNFTASWVFVGTWVDVEFEFDPGNVTFQVVLVSDDKGRSFVLMNYGALPAYSNPWLAGYKTGDVVRNYAIQLPSTTYLSSTTNVGIPGRWAFRVDGTPVPSTFYPILPDAVEIHLYNDGDAAPIQLNRTFNYFGRQFSQLYLSMNGFVSFQYISIDYYDSGLNRDIIAPLWADVDTYNKGRMFYSQVRSGPFISLATQQVNQMFPGQNFTASWVFVGTWVDVEFEYHSGDVNIQVVLVSDDAGRTFALLNYGDLPIYSNPWMAGYKTLDNTYNFIIQVPGTTYLSSTSNVGTPGRWAFRVDGNALPSTFYPILPDAVEIHLYNDGDAAPIQLNRTFNYFGRQFSQLYLSMNGFVSFEYLVVEGYDQNLMKDIIAPLWVDIDLYNKGKMFYSQVTSGPLIKLATEQVNQMFPGLSFTASWVLISTWLEVEFEFHPGDVTFQVVLVSDDRGRSFALMNYGDIPAYSYAWLTGYKTQDSTQSFVVPVQIITALTSTSNVGIPGCWALRVDMVSVPFSLLYPMLPGTIPNVVTSDGNATLIELDHPFLYFGRQYSQLFEVTFQVVLISGNMNRSFILMNYGDLPSTPNPQTWMAGYRTMDNAHSFSIPVESTADLSSTTNVGIPGRWALRVDGAVSASPPLFYPFGSGAGDTVNPKSDDGSSPAISLQNPFSFFGHSYSQLYVNNNGYLTFDHPSSSYIPAQFNANSGGDIIAPFWTDIDNRGTGVISYNQYTTGSVLSRATQDVKQHYPGVNFTASWVFVATWDKVGYYSYSGTETSFQVVLISGANFSFVLMNYGDIAPANYRAEAGYDTNMTDYYVSFWSNYTTSTDLKYSSNVNVPGRWAFLVYQGLNSMSKDDVVAVRMKVVTRSNLKDASNQQILLKQISMNGFVSFEKIVIDYYDSNIIQDIIAPLWGDIDSYNKGSIYQEQVTSGPLIKLATEQVNQMFPGLSFTASWVFVGTWVDAEFEYYIGDVTFQVVLVSDDRGRSFALLNYDSLPDYFNPWLAGYKTVDNAHHFTIQVSTTSDLNTTTNVGILGRWAFRVDEQSTPFRLLYPMPSDSTQHAVTVDGVSTQIQLSRPLLYFGNYYSQIHLCMDGFLSFVFYEPDMYVPQQNIDIIAPLWSDIDAYTRGNVSYKQDTTGSLIDQATSDINLMFPGLNFSASWILVGTWEKMEFEPDTGEVTFQVVVTSDSLNRTFVIMNYGSIPDNPGIWMAGYKTADNAHNFLIPASSTSNLFSTTNVGIPGRWAFRVDGAVSASPPLFYPFGSGAGDTVNPQSDDGSSPAISLQNPFSFFGRSYSQLYVNNNGYLTFDQPSSSYIPSQFNASSGGDIIAPFWTDIDNRGTGVISYNQYTTGSVLSRATQDVKQHYPGVNFTASWVFVATWDKVAYYSYSGTVRYDTV
ncbi:hypothetical protein NFI96_016161 [Prochilodus magdalenae]|nr:hypothetical protein NFI96_016161 [Prochilodus magdalenae]